MIGMPDREKVIKGLECCTKGGVCFSDCPYSKEVPMVDGRCITTVQADALALLKEQEPIEPIISYGTFRCGNCRNIVGYNDGYGRGYQNNFCSDCGRKVKWE